MNRQNRRDRRVEAETARQGGQTKQKHVDYRVTRLRIFATLAVVFLHTCTTEANNANMFAMSGSQRTVLTAAARLMHFSVPVFFMITGFLLLRPSKHITYRQAVAKYALRVFLALLIFGFAFGLIRSYAETRALSFMLIPQALMRIVTNNTFSHLWYLYTLIGIYLVLPVIKAFIDSRSPHEVDALLAVLFTFDFILPLVSTVTDTVIAFTVPFGYSLFYLILGYRLGSWGIAEENRKSIYIYMAQ